MLSSVEKIAFYLKLDPGRGRVLGVDSDTDEQRQARRSIIEWGEALSKSFEQYCNREFLTRERTQYFDARYLDNTGRFYPDATPIQSIESVYCDPLGQWQGSEFALTSDTYFPSKDRTNLQIIYTPIPAAPRGVRMVYSGGMARDATKSLYTLSDVEGSITAGLYCFGSVSGAYGRVIGLETVEDVVTMEVESLYGVFRAGDALTFQSALYAQDIPGKSAVIEEVTAPALCEAYPDIHRAVEIEVRYMQKHEFDFEMTSARTDGSSFRHLSHQSYVFQPETLAILNRYKRYLVGT